MPFMLALLQILIWRKYSVTEKSPGSSVPRHIAFIMDGNGRWAEQRDLNRLDGHREGYQTLRKILDHCLDLGTKYLTFYAFSKENWNRPKEEVEGLQQLLAEYLEENLSEQRLTEAREKGVRFRVIGDLLGLSSTLQDKVNEILEKTRNNQKHTVNIAFSYGGRNEIVEATQKIIRDVLQGKLHPENLTEEVFARYLFTAEIPDPDLLIRTGGEYRISNFLLYQIAYSELYITPTLWPDFGPKELNQAIQEYQSRERRFGLISAQVKTAFS